MQQPNGGSRATVVELKTSDFEELYRVVEQIQIQTPLRLQYILTKSQQCQLLRQETDFIQDLFKSHLELIFEMIDWMFMPKKIINRKQLKSMKGSNYPQPSLCRDFIKDNQIFYKQIYKASKNNTLPISIWFNFLINQSPDQQTIYTSLGYFSDIFIPFVSQNYKTAIHQSLNCDKTPENELDLTILKIFPQNLLKSLIQLSYHPQIFNFFKRLLLTSFQQQSDKKQAIQIFENLFIYAKGNDNMIMNMYNLLKQVIQNISTDTVRRGNIIITTFVKIQYTQFCIKRICQSQICKNIDFTKSIDCQNEQQIIQYYLKTLNIVVSIYCKFVKMYADNSVSKLAEKIQLQSNKVDVVKDTQQVQSQYYSAMKYIQSDVIKILKYLPQMCQMLKIPQTRTIRFSSGQNIKPITFVKYSYFQLLLKCLQLVRDRPQNLLIDMDKLDLFPLIQRYLLENRWNNILHHVLQKIVQLLIVNNYNFFQKNNMEKNNMANNFLGYLSQNFTNKNYIFLDTCHFTPYGNLHSLYIIAKIIAYQLDSNHSLVSLLDSFGPWKKLIMNDLKKYQDKTYCVGVPIDSQKIQQQQPGNMKVSVDQADSIKKLIAKIEMNKKWSTTKDIRKKKASNSSILRHHSSGKSFPRLESLARAVNQNNNQKNTNMVNSVDALTHNYLSSSQFSNSDLNKQLRLSYPPVITKYPTSNQLEKNKIDGIISEMKRKSIDQRESLLKTISITQKISQNDQKIGDVQKNNLEDFKIDQTNNKNTGKQ